MPGWAGLRVGRLRQHLHLEGGLQLNLRRRALQVRERVPVHRADRTAHATKQHSADACYTQHACQPARAHHTRLEQQCAAGDGSAAADGHTGVRARERAVEVEILNQLGLRAQPEEARGEGTVQRRQGQGRGAGRLG